jgi:hypothetical protein
MRSRRLSTILFSALVLASAAITAQVVTSQVDNARTGANTHETILTPSNVNSRQFGKLFSLKADGGVYAQPLYVPHLAIPGKGSHNVLFVATENDSVYAFDADGTANDPLWRVTFLKPGNGASTVPAQDVMCPFIQPGIGITPTPVIDSEAGTIYILARTSQGSGLFASPHYSQKLHALALTTGEEKSGSPVEIVAPGFDALRELPRAGLALVNGQIILTWASSCDVKPYHGFVMAYDHRTLKQTAVFNASPDAGEAGIWQSDNAPASDEAGNIYVATGNEKFTASATGRDYGDSLLKLGVDNGNLFVRDYFTPSDEDLMNSRDLDLGSGGPILLPDQSGPHPHLVLVGGKNGVLFVLDRDRLGHRQTSAANPVLQVLHLGGGIYSTPASWNGHLYVLASDDYLTDFAIDRGRISDAPLNKGTHRFGNPGATPTVSANGARNGIVWLIETKAWNDFGDRPAVLHACDAGNVARELYNSEENSPRDRTGAAMRFTTPTIANGRVYVAAKGRIDVYGLLSRPGRSSH